MKNYIVGVRVDFEKAKKPKLPIGCAGFLFAVASSSPEEAVKYACDKARNWLHANEVEYKQIIAADLTPSNS